MKLIKLLLLILLFGHCNANIPEKLIGKWRVVKFDHSLNVFNESEKTELNKRAKSTTYEFKKDFTVRVASGFTKSSKTGTWYWDEYREKLVINNNSVLEENVDTLFIKKFKDDKMSWMQTFSRTDTSFIYLKRVD
ncbi:MAG: hypothetical protein QNL21_00580 [Flavobacteriales bacterium]